MLLEMLVSLDIENITPTKDGSIHIVADDDIEVKCEEFSSYISFEGMIVILPAEDETRERILKTILMRNSVVARQQDECVFINSKGSTIIQQIYILKENIRIGELKGSLESFVNSIHLWRETLDQKKHVHDQYINHIRKLSA